METGFMYHARGIREQVYASTSYEGGRIILKIKTREQTLLCKVLKPSRDEERQHGETFPLRSHRVAPDNNRDEVAAHGVQALRCSNSFPCTAPPIYLADEPPFFSAFAIYSSLSKPFVTFS